MGQQRSLIAIAILAPLLALVLHVALNSPISPSPLVLPSSSFSSNNILQGVERLGEGLLEGPEDVCFDSEGTLYTATRDGWIKRKLAGNESWEEWRFVGGSAVLGIAISATGGIIACDADKVSTSSKPNSGKVSALQDLFDLFNIGAYNSYKIQLKHRMRESAI